MSAAQTDAHLDAVETGLSGVVRGAGAHDLRHCCGWIRVRTATIGWSSYATEKRMTVRCLLQLMIGSASCSSCIALVCVVLALTRRLTYRFQSL